MAQIQICRTCLEVIRKPSMFVALDGSNAKSMEIKSKLEACVPEMTINTVKSPVICSRCLISLNASYEFKRKCVATEEEIYNYLFDAEVDVVDLQLIADQSNADKSYCLVKKINKVPKEEPPPVCKTENNEISFKADEFEEKDDFKDFLISTVKDESMDCDFEATDDMLYFEDSKNFSTIEKQIPFEPLGEKTSTEQNENRNDPASIPDCSVVLTRLSDDVLKKLPHIDSTVDQNLSDQVRYPKKSSHKKKSHRKYSENNNVCYVCYPYNSNTVAPMKINKRTKLSDNEKLYRCGVCGFNSPVKLDIHMRIHTGEKPNKCHVCGFATAYIQHLKTHMKLHLKNKSGDCAYCEFSADSEMGLKKHMHNHPGCFMYKCSKCEYSTDSFKGYNCHKIIHTDRPFYECATCGLRTYQKRTLMSHVKLHIRDPWICCICQFSTTHQDSYINHLQTHIANMQQ